MVTLLQPCTVRGSEVPASFLCIADVLRPLLERLVTRSRWSLHEVHEMAKPSGLTPGAIEEGINSWAEEHLGGPLVEVDDHGWHVRAEFVARNGFAPGRANVTGM